MIDHQADSYIIEEKLPLRNKLAYGIAYIGNRSLAGIALGGAITFFYNYKMTLPARYTAFGWIIFAIWNAINDPLLGFIEDNTRSKWGRRIPYLRFGAPIFALTFIMCWYPLWTDTNTALFFSFLLNLFLFDTFYSMIGLITYSLPAEMCITSKCRSNLIMVGSFLAAIGELVSLVVPMILLTEDKGTTIHPAFRPVMIGLAIFAMLCLMWASYNIQENKFAQIEEKISFIESIRLTLRNKPFFIFEGANFFYTIAQTIVFTGMYYYVTLVLNLSGLEASLPLIIVYVVSLLALILWDNLNNKLGLKRVFLICLIVAIVADLFLFFFGDNLIAGFLALIGFGIGYGGVTLNQGTINGDTIDNDEIITGKRRETTYSGMNALITKPAISIANALLLWIIEAFGYEEPIGNETPYVDDQIILGIMLGFALIPAIVFTLAFVIMYFYPLDGSAWTEKKLQINEFHRKKEESYLLQLQSKKTL